MPRHSAGVLVYRRRPAGLEIFLVHPGGPFWARKDARAWSFPKGELAAGETPEEAARREFREETGQAVAGPLLALAPTRQPGGKIVHIFAVEGEVDETAIHSNDILIEWPPRSGRRRSVPEIDRGAWVSVAAARGKLHAGLVPILDAFLQSLPAATRP